jgi:multiple sugar transport system substrate-binding protein
VIKRPAKLLATTAIAASLTISLAACGKGGTDNAGPAASGETQTLTMWTHNAGNKDELAAVTQVVDDYNASQTAYKVDLQAFPQDSYNQSVVAAAAAKKLPCILDIDQPNVANWAWAGYLAPIEGLDDVFANYLPSTVAKWNGVPYAFGYYDVSLTWVTRESILEKYDIRVPTIDQPWTGEEFMAALKSVKDSGDFDYPADLATGWTGEWWPYGYSPHLQSFGGDLINRTDYKSAEGVLNGDAAVEWANWFAGLARDGLISKKSSADPTADFINGKTAFLWNGSWTAVPVREEIDDVVFAPPVDFGSGAKVGGGSWTWGYSTGCESKEGALDYLKFAAQDKYVALVSEKTNNIPATDAAAAMVPGFEAGGENDIFRQYSKKFTVMRPETPGYPFIATTFAKGAQDILNGADPKQTLDQMVADIDDNQETNDFFQS